MNVYTSYTTLPKVKNNNNYNYNNESSIFLSDKDLQN